MFWGEIIKAANMGRGLAVWTGEDENVGGVVVAHIDKRKRR